MSYGQTQPVVLRRGIRFRHGSLFCHQASGCVNSSSAARALCGIGIAPYVATFLVNIFHLSRSYSYLANLEKSSPIHTWSSGRLRWRELEDTRTNADGWHEWRWFQISDLVFGFPTMSIAHHKINMQNKQYFPALKPANLKEAFKRADWVNTTIKEARVGSAHFISGNVKVILYHPFLFA